MILAWNNSLFLVVWTVMLQGREMGWKLELLYLVRRALVNNMVGMVGGCD